MHYRAHQRWRVISYVTGATVGIGLWQAGYTIEGMMLGVFIPLGYYFGRWVDPDLDLLGLSSGDGRYMRELYFIGALFVAYWTVYAYVMNKLAKRLRVSKPLMGAHRSVLTHSFLGTCIRMLWANIPIGILLYYLGALRIPEGRYIFAYYLLGTGIGLAIADALHVHLDRTHKGTNHNDANYGTRGDKPRSKLKDYQATSRGRVSQERTV